MIEQEQRSIEGVRGLLADEESRRVLDGLLAYRRSRKLSGLVMSAYPQYEHPVVHAKAGDVIVEGGAWIGDTAERFAQMIGATGRVYCFEPTPGTYKQLTDNIAAAGLSDIVKGVNAGLGAAEGTADFCMSGGDSGGFYVAGQYGSAASGDIRVRITSCDAFCVTEHIQPSFIKMDIEGSELAAIEGARETIVSCKPRLAICVYHKPSDLWTIALRLHELNPGYLFYLGQHVRGITETVLYAIDG